MHPKFAFIPPILLAFSSSSVAAETETRFAKVRRADTPAGECKSTNATEHGHGAHHGAGRQGAWRHAHHRNGTMNGTLSTHSPSSLSAEPTTIPANTDMPVFDSSDIFQNHAASLELSRAQASAPTLQLSRGQAKPTYTLSLGRGGGGGGGRGPAPTPRTSTSSKPTSTSTTSSKPALATTRSSSSSSSSTSIMQSSSSSVVSFTPTSSKPATTAPITGSGDTPPDAWSAGILSAHNAARSTHGAENLVWSSELTAAAETWAKACVWHHGGTGSIPGGAGQNLAAGASSEPTASQSGQAVVDSWMSEESAYDPKNPTYSHFTQLVWKNTQELGCFQASCEGSKFVNPDGTPVFASNMKSVVFTTCNYRKPGNYAGQYAANVQKNI